MLSLVLLVGYAGEVSLATMALAGIGGTVFYHHVGHDATSRAGLMAFVIAMVATALVGAVIALPALRLRGLYLALATAAFSLGVEQMVFKEYTVSRRIYPATLILIVALGLGAVYRGFRSHHVRGALVAAVASGVVLALAATNPWLQKERWSPIFPNGNLQVPRPRLFGIDFNPAGQLPAPARRRLRDPRRGDDRAPPQRVRPPADRDEEQPGRVRDARHERRAAQAVGVHDLGRDRRSGRLPVRAGDRLGHRATGSASSSR